MGVGSSLDEAAVFTLTVTSRLKFECSSIHLLLRLALIKPECSDRCGDHHDHPSSWITGRSTAQPVLLWMQMNSRTCSVSLTHVLPENRGWLQMKLQPERRKEKHWKKAFRLHSPMSGLETTVWVKQRIGWTLKRLSQHDVLQQTFVGLCLLDPAWKSCWVLCLGLNHIWTSRCLLATL